MFFIVIGRDKPEMTDVRARTRPAHLDYMGAPNDKVRHMMGAPLAADDGETMTGTFYIVEAPDRETALAYAKGDPYARAEIFATLDVIQVHPAGAKAMAQIGPKAT